jgi:hemoglobin
MEDTSALKARTAYDLVGGKPAVRRIVDRFYDLLDIDPAYRQLRALHASDLDPMRSSLAGFLVAWLGGPRDWFEEHPGRCMMSAHRDVRITEETARQWADAMSRAVHDSTIDKELAHKLTQALSAMALGMGGVPALTR